MDIQKEIEVHNRHYTRKRLDEVDEALGNVIRAVENYRQAFPTCEEHKPNGGTRTECLECYIIKLTYALSKIDYLCGEPNEMQSSAYDTHCDENLVVKAVESFGRRMVAVRAALRASTELLCDMIKTNDLTWRSLMQYQIAANETALKGSER